MLDSQALARTRIWQRLGELDRQKEWLARRLGVDGAAMHRWLKGEQPIPEARLREIALVLHRPEAWFVAPEKMPEPKEAVA